MRSLLRPRPAKYHDHTAEREGRKCNCVSCLKLRGEFEVFIQTTSEAFRPKGEKKEPTKSLLCLLQEHFGLGDAPEKRNALYARLSLLAERDRRVEMLVLECVSMAEGKQNPASYFCRAITCKLRECGVYSWPK